MKLGIAVAPREALPSAFVVFRDDLKLNIGKAAALGYDGVELALLDASQVDVPEVKAQLDKLGLEIPMVSSGQVFAQGGLCFSSPERAVREEAVARIKGLVDVAVSFGAMVNIGRVRGPAEPGAGYADSEKRFIDGLREVADYAAPRGVVIAVEPVNRYEINFINRVDQAAGVIGKAGRSNVKIMPDVFHMNIEDRGIEAALVEFIDEIAYIHFADSNRLAPGMGHLHFPNIVFVLESLGYEGYVTVEILPHPDPDAAAAQAARYLRALIPRV